MSMLVLRLVLQQLRHEWPRAACLCIALGAAIIPLLMILGLKEGTVATLRQRLLSDPANLEVRMIQTTRLTDAEIKSINKLSGVGFCVPCPRALAASVIIYRAGKENPRQESYLIPTDSGDPLLLCYKCPIPREGEIVISAGVADKTGLAAGDTATVEASCYENGRLVRSAQSCRVIGILPEESGVSMQSYVPLSLVVGVEEYIEGLRTGIGQDAKGVEPRPVYHGVWLNKPESVARMRAGMWSMVCPFREQRAPLESELTSGVVSHGNLLYYNTAQFVQIDKLRKAYSLAKQHGAGLLLWNPPLQGKLRCASVEHALSIVGEPAPPVFGSSAPVEYRARSGEHALLGEHLLELEGGSSAPICIEYDSSVPPGELRCTVGVLGGLHQIRHRNLSWNSVYKRFEVKDRTFSRVRLYADGLEEVEPLVQAMEKLGYRTVGNIASIRRVQNLNRQLETLFMLIACIGVAGAACSLALSLFNSAMKRQREYAIISTLGMPRRSLMLFPVFEACILTFFSLCLSFATFHIMARIIAEIFAAEIGSGESLCSLSPQLHLTIAIIGLAIGLCAALVAALTVLRVQPSIAIREN